MISRSETTIVFEDPFWVAIFEQYRNGYYSVAREVIGTSEPQGSELVLFFRKLDYENLKFTLPVKGETINNKKLRFKRQMKQIRTAQFSGQKYTFTKAHALIKVNQTALKEEKKKESRVIREEEKREKFTLKQQKKKEKQKGR